MSLFAQIGGGNGDKAVATFPNLNVAMTHMSGECSEPRKLKSLPIKRVARVRDGDLARA